MELQCLGVRPELVKGRLARQPRAHRAASTCEGKMKFRVGTFTCELSLDDGGHVQAQWLPWQPKYLNKDERVQYQAGRAAFLERANPAMIASVADRLSGAEPGT